jgi:hypothetical protein
LELQQNRNLSPQQQLLLSQMQARQQLPTSMQQQMPNAQQPVPQALQMPMVTPQVSAPIPQPQAPPLQSQQTQQPQSQVPTNKQPQQTQSRPSRAASKKSAKRGQDASNPLVIGNTPTPTNIPTPSPAQNPAALPSTTPVNIASPAAMHHPGSTPRVGVSPADMHTPSAADTAHPVLDKNADYQMAGLFVKREIEKLRPQLAMANIPAKNLTAEEKEQMLQYNNDPTVMDYLRRLAELAQLLYAVTKDEAKTRQFLQLVFQNRDH